MGAMAVMAKPEGSTWTDDQWRAIVTEGSDVLVAAAAGSGKTAVLVERIIRKISSNTDVDRLLVATFTKAAASEMKERIRIALEKALEQQPGSEHLQRQLALMNRASITTLHSFCLDVIRRYYPLIGLDPGFRIANETESELMRIDVLDQLFEARYEGTGDGGAFLRLADRYGGERGDEPLYRLVLQLHDFAHSDPWPEQWLRTTAAAFRMEHSEELSSSEWAACLQQDVQLTLQGAQSLLVQALELTRLPAGPAPYAEAITEDLYMLGSLVEKTSERSWLECGEAFQAISYGKLKPLRGDSYDKRLQEQVKSLRDGAKSMLTSLTTELFGRTAEEFAEELTELAPLMEALAELVIDFGRQYEAAKRNKGLLDFGDLEHYCLRILRDTHSSPDRSTPSRAALDYQNQFDEILLDEYQDTNRVQEAIVALICKPGRGNRFMVGDVKQSIYRFRLAEPNLFLQKYKSYAPADSSSASMTATDLTGLRIDLARNFRSREEVVDGVNDVFRAIMRESVAEMDYDKRAELVCGASYPPADSEQYSVELALINRGATGSEEEEAETTTEEDESGPPKESAADLQTAQLEARWIASRIHELMSTGFQVYDPKLRASRQVGWRDFVILLRATSAWSPVIIEELQSAGIPAYAELSSGYFDAVEVETIMSLLRVIDNPYQDIPLAGILRSPIFGLHAEELAAVRIRASKGTYYDAVLAAAGDLLLEEETRRKLSLFLNQLDRWRSEARQGSLTDLIGSIYRETGYYDFTGGLPGGVQRQANLRALHDRARQYEATSFRGLFRFLRFIERMKDNGGDLGAARALGEQEDVVRIMSIHKSKGLEFPVVFCAGLGKMFNQQDVRSAFLKHKELGFGPKFINLDLRTSYPTLPYLAIRRRMKMEMLAEEMRILYVALTRPKEKLYLVGTLSDAEKKRQSWQTAIDAQGQLPDYRLASARTFLDWLGPLASQLLESTLVNVYSTDAVATPVRHEGQEADPNGNNQEIAAVAEDATGAVPLTNGNAVTVPLRRWKAAVVPSELFGTEAAASTEDDSYDIDIEERLQAISSLVVLDDVELEEDLRDRLEWQYPYKQSTTVPAKSSVTEMKRLHSDSIADAWNSDKSGGSMLSVLQGQSNSDSGVKSRDEESWPGNDTFRLRRPAFMEEKSVTAAERGTVSHLIMQHVDFEAMMDELTVQQLIDDLVRQRLLTAAQAKAVNARMIADFLEGELGQRLRSAEWVRREVPFSCMFPAERVYPEQGQQLEGELILIQGVIDCLFKDEHGLVLLDYKTDRIYMNNWDQAAERHRFQLELYAEAIEQVLGAQIDESYVFFFDGGQSVQIR
ncbi:helicase-exonuclease AddAB subunit AddA [Paenibacillus sp. GCM10023252]|uniref:helicase-exonuclease AddAB subunit AddA n=1 Tax=Paenibacillus sp. GCM10023252 TaxID=3252649 RepID=UPI0036070D72